MCPFAHTDGDDFPGLIDELVPGLATVRDDVVVVGEDAVGEPVVAQELPDVLHRVQFGRTRRQEEQRDVGGHDELGRHVPASAVNDQNGMGARIDDHTGESSEVLRLSRAIPKL